MKLTTKDLEQICFAQSNKVKYLHLDVSMRYVRKGKAELVYWNVHDKGSIKNSIANFMGIPEVATFKLIQWITIATLPEYL